MKVARKSILAIKPYVGGKPIADVKRELGLSSVIKLASNENPYPPSKKVLAAIAKAAKDINRYPDGNCFELRAALAKRLKVKPEQLVFGNGSDEIIVMAVKAFVREGDEVVIARPSFLIYDLASRIAGARVREVPLKDFRYDLDGMRRAVNKWTKIVFIGNPDNPAGTYVTRKQLDAFLKSVSREVLVFIDEAYFEYVRAKDYPDGIALIAKHPNMVVTRTFSKMYGLAGLRVGYGVAQPAIIDILNHVREPFNVNSVAQAAAVAAFTDRAYYAKIAKDIEVQRQYLYRALTAMGIEYEVSFTNFILVRTGGQNTAQALLKKGVIVRDMAAWRLKGHIRVSLGTAAENKRFIQTLRKVLS